MLPRPQEPAEQRVNSIEISTQRHGPIHLERRAQEVILMVAGTTIRLSLEEAWMLSESLDQISTSR